MHPLVPRAPSTETGYERLREHHVLSEPDPNLRAARLGLCGLVLAVLTGLLDLLGIEVPERM